MSKKTSKQNQKCTDAHSYDCAESEAAAMRADARTSDDLAGWPFCAARLALVLSSGLTLDVLQIHPLLLTCVFT